MLKITPHPDNQGAVVLLLLKKSNYKQDHPDERTAFFV
jgi:hypothetical protein